ncbi:putative catabolite repression protein creC [Powellomyces hirtus]|nr:putative catabolite repression protein creC [Powellomyces hirtus]
MQQQELITGFDSPEGQFKLSRDLQLERTLGQRKCHLAFVTNKTSNPTAASTGELDELENQPARYVEVPISGDDKGTFSFVQKEKGKAKKVKSAIVKPSSSLVSKVVANENLAKILSNRANETTYMLLNIGTSLGWMEYGGKSKDPLSTIYFRDATATCIDINVLTKDNIDTIIGFNTGDILHYSPMTGKFVRINKQGCINKAGVTSIKWMPPRGQGDDENMFAAGFEDGSVIIFDKEKPDPPADFTPTFGNDDSLFAIMKPPKNPKSNPCGWWQAGRKFITAIATSPDFQHIAIASADGHMHIVDYKLDCLVETYRAYYGGITCVDWSPDGKYILTGGQDDIVTIWQFQRGIVARCHGHSSWISGVAFDPHLCTESSYRFASIGDDTRLFLWEFSLNQLTRPKPSIQRKHRQDNPHLTQEDGVYPVLSQKDVGTLAPIESEGFRLHNVPLCALTFRDDALVTTDMLGLVRIWQRPPNSI